MTFITEQDFAVRIRNTNLQRLTDADSTVLQAAIDEAESTLSHYLSSRFDIKAIFKAPEEHQFLLQLGISIALYALYNRTPSVTMPPKIEEAFNSAITELRDLRDGRGGGSLPVKTVNGQPQLQVKIGSDKPRTYF